MMKFNKTKGGGFFVYVPNPAELNLPYAYRTYVCRFCEDDITKSSSTILITIKSRSSKGKFPFKCCPKEECKQMAALIGQWNTVTSPEGEDEFVGGIVEGRGWVT